MEITQIKALLWAQNELSHDLDETGCCQKWCESCKNIQKNPEWKDWWNRSINPIEVVLERYHETKLHRKIHRIPR